MLVFAVQSDDREVYEELLPEDLRGLDLLMVAAGEESEDGLSITGISAFEEMDAGVWELAWIHVVSDKCRQGVGQAMIRYGETLVRAAGGDEIRASYLLDEDGKPLDKCLKKAGFEKLHKSEVRQATVADFYDGIKKYSKRIEPKVPGTSGKPKVPGTFGSQVYPVQVALDEFEHPVFPEGAFAGADEARELDVADLYGYIPEVSMLSLTSEGEINGFIFFEEAGEKLSISYIWAEDSAGRIFMDLITSAIKAIKSQYPADKYICFNAVDPVVNELAGKLLKNEPEYIGAAVVLAKEL